MTSYKQSAVAPLTPYSSYEERATTIESCPYCHNDKIGKTPRRKGGPSMFRCRNCGYMTNIDLVYDMHRLLGQVPV